MNPFFIIIVLLNFSLATAANFTQVFQWNEMDYVWPSAAKRTQALEDETFKPDKIEPLYMAVHGTRIFLSLDKVDGIPVTLVSLPTRSAASPKLTPFPSWEFHGKGGDCNKIQAARGLAVDSVDRLWVLDDGSILCKAKLWTIGLSNLDHIELIHQFSFYGQLHDLGLDETPNGTLAYITRRDKQYIVVFSLEKKQSWNVSTPRIKVFSIALSPKEEPRKLYLGTYYSNELYSISVDALRNGTRTGKPKLIGKWTAIDSYRMLMDSYGTMYAAFWRKNFILSWNSSQPFEENCFHEVGELNTFLPFTFALDSSGTFWLTDKLNKTGTKPRLRLLKAEVGVKPYISDSPTTGKKQTDISTLIGSLAFLLVLSCTIILCLSILKKLRNSNEQRDAGFMEMEIPAIPNPVSPQMVDEEIENDLYAVFTAPPPRPRL